MIYSITYTYKFQLKTTVVLLPWGNSYDDAPGIDKMQAMADKANEALFAVHGTQFDVG